jgi:hypothetical protein
MHCLEVDISHDPGLWRMHRDPGELLAGNDDISQDMLQRKHHKGLRPDLKDLDMPRRIMERMQEKISRGLYALAAHAQEEMYDDNLVEEDIEHVITHGTIVRTERDQLARRRYTVEGSAQETRTVRVFCRFSDAGNYLLVFTVYVLRE